MTLVRVVELRVADEPADWEGAGFSVQDEVSVVGDVRLRFGGGSGGIAGWTVVDPDGSPGEVDLDGLATTVVTDSLPIGPAAHENGTVGLDHIVVSTPDLERTSAAFGSLGVDARRSREAGTGDRPMIQRFFRMGSIVEVVAPADPDRAGGPARFWGLAVVSDDLDRTAEVLGDRLRQIKDAVQPGRRIATLRTRELGISVPVAFMTPHRP